MQTCLDVTAGVIVEAICNADILTINANALQMSSQLQECEWEDDERTPEELCLSVLNPHLSTNSLILYGSCKDEQVLLEAFGRKDVDLKIIPPETTKYAQALDVYFFRQYKIYAKRIRLY